MEKIYTLVDCESDFTIKLTSGEFVEYREYTEEQVHSFAQQVLPWEVEKNYEEEHLFSDGDNGGYTTSENCVYPIFSSQMLVKGSEVIGCIIDGSKLLFEDCDREIKNLSSSSEGRHDITERTTYRLRKAKGYGSVWTWDESSNTITIFGDSISITQYFRDNAKKVIIEDGVTIIEDSTFAACKKLESVIVPESIEHVGYQAFKDCPMLRFQKMSDIRYLGNETNPFLVAVDAEEKKCHYTLSDSTKVISDGVFEFHYSLESIVIPEGVTTIGEKAFAFCGVLKSVTLPDSMKSIGKEAFYECGLLESIVIPEGVTTIGEKAFYECGLLESIVIPEGVTTIGEKAFAKCCSLKSANLPKSVKDIGDAAFWGCKLLRNTDFPDRLMFNMRDFQIKDGVLVNYKGHDSDLLIPNGVTRIGAYSLSRAYWGLKNVRIPEGVTEIGKGAFYGCKDLECISLPDSLKSIEEKALQSTSLRKVNIPHGITTIDGAVFFGCDKLKEINIPDGVENIGGFAFSCCYSLESAVIPGSVRNIGKDAFGSCRSLKYVTINNGVKVIGEEAFHGCRSLESITIPESVKHIGRSAFYECDSLKTVMILGESCDIECDAFLGCDKRLNIVVPKIGIVDDDKESRYFRTNFWSITEARSFQGFLAYPELYEDSAKAQIREYMKKYEAEALRGFKIRDFSREAFAAFLEKLNPDDAWLDFLKKLFADSKTIQS